MFENIIDMIGDRGFNVHAVEVLCSGETALHHAFHEDKRCPVYSITKSVTSAAFSLACDDEVVSAEMPLAEYLEKRYRAVMPDEFAKLPFKRFLTMTAGKYPFRPEGDDWISGILSLGTDHSDNSFHYSNIPAYLVGAALENALGRKLPEYLQERLFDSLGIPSPKFRTSPEGHFYGATGMELTVHELALLGELYRRRGEWQGSRIISEAAVKEAVSAHVPLGGKEAFAGSFGYFFRVYGDRFEMGGKWGQRCMIFPERRLVLSYLAVEPERSEELLRAMYAAVTL